MKRGRMALCFMVVLLVLGGIDSLSAQSAGGVSNLPGITTKDPYPNGCVDCHKDAGSGKDYRVLTMLAKISTHPKIDKIVKVVPDDCLMCHKAGPKPPVFSQVMHKAHFEKPATNTFVTTYTGSCLNCHSLDQSTGAMNVKSGPKNW